MSAVSRSSSERPAFFDWLLFLVVALLFLCSLLVFLSAPTSWLWVVALLVVEWGHWFALAALSLAILSWQRGRRGRLTAALAFVAAALMLSPAIRAAGINRSLPNRLSDAFGSLQSLEGRPRPFVWLDLFRGLPTSGVTVSEHVYAQVASKTLTLDLYRAQNVTAPEPIILMVHGGSWRRGNNRQLAELNRYLAQEHYAVASINYRHAPKAQFPAPVEDTFAAIDFLKRHAAEWQMDATRIVLIGRSAGGQIALLAAYDGREPGIKGVAAFYAPSDLVLGYEHPSRRWVLDSKQVLESYLGGSPAEKREVYDAASPVRFVGSATPPTLLIHGDLDPIVWPEQSARLAERLKEAGRPVFRLYLPWGTHGCDANLNGPSGQLSTYAIDRFLANVLHSEGDR